MRRGPERVAQGLVLLAQLIALAVVVGRWSASHGFPLDDAWIHQVVARTFARTGTLGTAPGAHGAGATSTLWALLLALNYRFFHADPVAYTLALGGLATVGSGQCLLALLLRARPEPEGRRAWVGVATAAIVAGVAGVGGNFVWYAASGMEAPLAVFLPLAAVLLWTRPGGSRGALVAAGGCAAALALLRPEGALFAPLLAVWGLRRGRPWRELVAFLLPTALGLALLLGSNLLLAGSLWPATLAGRRWLWLGSGTGATPWLTFPLGLLNRLGKYSLASASDSVLIFCLALMALGLYRLVRLGEPGLRLFLLWTGVHVLTFALAMPTPGHGGRYQPEVPLVFLCGATFGALTLAGDLVALLRWQGHAGARVAALVLPAVPLLWGAASSLREWQGLHAKAVRHIDATELAMGALVDRLPAGARVASYDIGGIGFASHRPILDIGGLSSARSAALLREARIWELLRAEHADYVIVPSYYRDDVPQVSNFGARLALLENPALVLEPVRELRSPPELWFPAVQATWNASPRQVLYKIHDTGQAGPRMPVRSAAGLPLADPDHLLSWRTRSLLRGALSALAGAGTRVALAVSRVRPPAEPPRPDAWVVRLGPWGFDLAPPAGIPDAAARALFAERVQPYVEARDLDGASLAALHAIARILRRTVDATYHPLLPTVDPPHAPEPPEPFPWGAFAAVLVLVPGAVAAARARGAPLP